MLLAISNACLNCLRISNQVGLKINRSFKHQTVLLKMCKSTVVTAFLCLTLFGLVLTKTSEDLRVTLSNGSKLLGKYLSSNNGRPIKAFTNIPYAKAPIGPLRFKVDSSLQKKKSPNIKNIKN